MKLHTAMIFVVDMARMVAFYRDVMGLRYDAARSDGDWAELEAGGARVALHRIPADIAGQIDITQPPRAREDGAIKLVFAVEDVVAARAALIAQGVAMREIGSWGGCDGIDPEGNVFQIIGQQA